MLPMERVTLFGLMRASTADAAVVGVAEEAVGEGWGGGGVVVVLLNTRVLLVAMIAPHLAPEAVASGGRGCSNPVAAATVAGAPMI